MPPALDAQSLPLGCQEVLLLAFGSTVGSVLPQGLHTGSSSYKTTPVCSSLPPTPIQFILGHFSHLRSKHHCLQDTAPDHAEKVRLLDKCSSRINCLSTSVYQHTLLCVSTGLPCNLSPAYGFMEAQTAPALDHHCVSSAWPRQQVLRKYLTSESTHSGIPWAAPSRTAGRMPGGTAIYEGRLHSGAGICGPNRPPFKQNHTSKRLGLPPRSRSPKVKFRRQESA